MKPTAIFINPETQLLRSGWRLLIFLAILSLYQFFVIGGSGAGTGTFQVGWEMIGAYVVSVIWVVMVSWLCLKFLDRLTLGALGLTLHRGWWREVWLGCAISAAMMTAIVALQVLGGGTHLTPNPMITAGNQGIAIIAQSAALSLLLFMLAGAFEELLFRGYPFQTLLRGAPAIVPILLFSILFGWAHWTNPNRTVFSTANTVLAGIWLSVAYLKTRRLWFPTALHFMWNWMMGIFYGLPVSGLRITSSPLFISTSEEPVWLTGGNYGSEGGVAATAVYLIVIIVLWRARWLTSAPTLPMQFTEGLPDRVIEK
jgi:membrane protease YdiL (CAAX protease family)